MKALLIVDIQNDFLPGGSLGVKEGDQIIPIINRLTFQDFDVVVASKDWHPEGHKSFASTHGKQPGEHIKNPMGRDQVLWPQHCVQNSKGAEFSADLDTSRFKGVFYKGTDKEIDSYSSFFDNEHLKATGLGEYFKEVGVTDVYIVGLTTDYCVKYSVLDAVHLGFKAHVILDACRAVNLQDGDAERAVEAMRQAGAEIITSEELSTR